MTYGEAGTARLAIGSGLINHGIPKVSARSKLYGCDYYLIIHMASLNH